MRPMGSYEIARSTTITAPPERIHALINDFRKWVIWNPFEDGDPALHRLYHGRTSGVGAKYEWKGNRKVGSGAMEIVASTPERIDIDLRFTRPFRADARARFVLTPLDGETQVTWAMYGQNRGLMRVAGRLVSMDVFLGRDLDRGLSRLTAAAAL